jgi:DNA mismatch endonuclease (patch repair protein)
VTPSSYPHPRDPLVSMRMRRNPRSDTKPERQLRSALFRAGLRFRKNYAVRADGRLIRPDIVFPKLQVAVFVDGCFWHHCPEHGNEPRHNAGYWGPKLRRNVARDREVDRALVGEGWLVIRVWEHEDVAATAKRITGTVAALQRS